MCELIHALGRLRIKFLGDHRGEDPPDPIPNSEVKLAIADGTARVTLWESRSSPGIQFKKARHWRAFFLYTGSRQHSSPSNIFLRINKLKILI